MADRAEIDNRIESGTSPDSSFGTRLGRVRWTICAMLFVATSINYMDRQVIAILKPTLQQSIGLTEVSYGYIVDAFQIAYALGLLAAGRLIDKLGTRIGYMLMMAVWSLSAMGHALASTAMEFGFARFFLGLGESGNFPAAIKTVAEWFPQNERSLATGIFNSGANVGAILAPAIVPWSLQRALDFVVAPQLPQAHRTPYAYERRTAAHLPRSGRGDGPVSHCALAPVARLPPNLGVFDREIPYRSDLVVLFVLAAVLLQFEIQSGSFASWAAAHYCL